MNNHINRSKAPVKMENKDKDSESDNADDDFKHVDEALGNQQSRHRSQRGR